MLTPRNDFFYYDEYMFFTFDNIHSSEYNLVIQNDIDDLKLYVSTGAQVDLVSSQYQKGQHVLGVTRPQREFPLVLMASGLTRAQIINMMHWLKAGAQGNFKMDFTQDWEFDVVINSVSDPNLYEQDNNTFVASFEITFITTTSPYARNAMDAILDFDSAQNEFYLKEQELEENQFALIENCDGAFNNNLVLPSVVLYDRVTTDKKTTYHYRINFLGDDSAEFYYRVSYGSDEKENYIAGLYKLNLDIKQDKIGYDFISTLSFTLKENSIRDRQVIQYNSPSNLFFINNILPQQANFNGLMKVINNQYNYSPLVLQSPGKPILIEGEEHFKQLVSTAYNWFLCKPGTFDSNTQYFSNIGDFKAINPYPTQTSNCFILYDTECTEDFSYTDVIGSEECYFGFYSEVVIEHGCEYYVIPSILDVYNTLNSIETAEESANYTPNFQGTLTIRQYTEVI